MAASLDQLQGLVSRRTRPSRDQSIASVISSTAQNVTRTHRKLGELIEIWEELVPPELASHTSLASLARGVLQVTVDSSSSLFELDRQLRGGLTENLRRRFRGTLVRVKTRFAGAEAESQRPKVRVRGR